jgi:hypothetical protein
MHETKNRHDLVLENDDPREFFDVDEDLSSNTYDTPSNEIIESSSFMNTETENSCVLTTFARRNKLPAQRKEFNTVSFCVYTLI